MKFKKKSVFQNCVYYSWFDRSGTILLLCTDLHLNLSSDTWKMVKVSTCFNFSFVNEAFICHKIFFIYLNNTHWDWLNHTAPNHFSFVKHLLLWQNTGNWRKNTLFFNTSTLCNLGQVLVDNVYIFITEIWIIIQEHASVYLSLSCVMFLLFTKYPPLYTMSGESIMYLHFFKKQYPSPYLAISLSYFLSQ